MAIKMERKRRMSRSEEVYGVVMPAKHGVNNGELPLLPGVLCLSAMYVVTFGSCTMREWGSTNAGKQQEA